MNAQLLIRCWERDLDWLEVCAQSVNKYWKEPLPPIVVATPGCDMPSETFEWKWIFRPKVFNDLAKGSPQDHHRQGAVMIPLHADQYVTLPSSEIFAFIDADCLFTRTTTADDLCFEGKPIMKMDYRDKCVYSDEANGHILEEYYDVCRQVLGPGYGNSPFDFMRTKPYVFSVGDIRSMRNWIETSRNKSISDVAIRYHPNSFCEFNLLGTWAWNNSRDSYIWALPSNWRPPCVREFHSWSQKPSDPGVKEEIDRILA